MISRTTLMDRAMKHELIRMINGAGMVGGWFVRYCSMRLETVEPGPGDSKAKVF
jgi:hypothetical protein